MKNKKNKKNKDKQSPGANGVADDPRADREGYRLVFAKYITRNGRKIPPPAGRTCWAFWVKDANAT